jgi:hypothetical protein
MLLLDCRAERKKDQVCSKLTYDRIFAAIKALPTLKHLVFQLGIPIAYRPSSLCAQARDLAYSTLNASFQLTARMNFLEKTLESKANPLTTLGKMGVIPGFVNKCVRLMILAERGRMLRRLVCKGSTIKPSCWMTSRTTGRRQTTSTSATGAARVAGSPCPSAPRSRTDCADSPASGSSSSASGSRLRTTSASRSSQATSIAPPSPPSSPSQRSTSACPRPRTRSIWSRLSRARSSTRRRRRS